MATENDTELTFKALITDQEVEQLEKIARGFNRHRRAVLAMLTRSSDQLMDGRTEQTYEAMELLHEISSDYLDHLCGLVEQAECAKARAVAMMLQLEAAPEPQV